ncbi:bifunctional riboflavin kinase/FAD synthetase [Acidiferrimicrobium sp. IK]|uniref:bifunctional riboflavin kinase/FAD synthetase n=1 Tax=Acidiferrimicrobium sp. IK TaxID=2871700 RepID=UPI0021CB0DA0|nr:bifunctional riboflavin kinase/FAD synthetase [Acidiferrimicrobium sp. IK]MCU4183741.1 bifunctional riboflavin kinase/FAD synthetase [Acidiferrimicrobium sp. IK]
MEIAYHPGDCPRPESGTVATIGVYDGVHLGHRHVINEVRASAAELGARSAVVTFDPHPASVLRPDAAPKLLTDREQKMELLSATGLDMTMVVRFDEARSEESAEDFVESVLVGCLNVKRIIVGEDFHFGHGRKGNVELLTRMGEECGFEVTGVRAYQAEARDASGASAIEPVSSTRIRRLLAAGEVESAASLLGRPHQVRGVVGHGDKRGRTLGFPTANVAVPFEMALPADGVYAGWYRRPGGRRLPAAVSLGRRPTFYVDADLSLLEAHLLDFDDDLYDEVAEVEFVGRLRGQEAFASVEALIEQMGHDVSAARRLLAAPPT